MKREEIEQILTYVQERWNADLSVGELRTWRSGLRAYSADEAMKRARECERITPFKVFKAGLDAARTMPKYTADGERLYRCGMCNDTGIRYCLAHSADGIKHFLTISCECTGRRPPAVGDRCMFDCTITEVYRTHAEYEQERLERSIPGFLQAPLKFRRMAHRCAAKLGGAELCQDPEYEAEQKALQKEPF